MLRAEVQSTRHGIFTWDTLSIFWNHRNQHVMEFSLTLSSDIMVSNKLSDFSTGNMLFKIPAILLCYKTRGEETLSLKEVENESREGVSSPVSRRFSVLSLSKECRWREMEEHRQAERLQRQLQQEQAYLLSLQHDHRRPHPQQPPPPQQERSKPSYHAPEPKPHYEPADRAREVSPSLCCLDIHPVDCSLESGFRTLKNCMMLMLEGGLEVTWWAALSVS